MLRVKLLLPLLFFLPTLLVAQTWHAENTDKQMAVLELFTSEGCGLCPAADRWVHNLPLQGVTDDDLIVLGFHIDYLNDKKGWVDRFASPIFSDRQRQQAQLNLYQTVYTPEFVVSGEIIHNWQKHVKEVVHAVNLFEPEATIALSVNDQNGTLMIESQVSVEGAENRQYAKLYLAILEDDISSYVAGGDNAGMTFNHQSLVRKWLGPFALNNTGKTNIDTSVALDNQWKCDKLSVVALVQNLNDGFVLQGLKLPLLVKEK